MMIFPWKTHCLAVCRRDGRMQKKMKFSRFWQFDRCQVWLQSGLTAVRSDCCQIRQLSANACRISEFQFLSPSWFFTDKFLDFIFSFFGKKILTKKWVLTKSAMIFYNSFFGKDFLTKNWKNEVKEFSCKKSWRTKELKFKYTAGVGWQLSNLTAVKPDSCQTRLLSDLTAVRSDSSQANLSSNSKYSNNAQI